MPKSSFVNAQKEKESSFLDTKDFKVDLYIYVIYSSNAVTFMAATSIQLVN